MNRALCRIFTLLFAMPLLTAAGCALFAGSGDGPAPRAQGYSVNAPSSWSAEGQKESDRAYRLPSNAVVTVNSSCIRNAKAPLETLTRQLLFGLRNVNFQKKEKFTVAGSEGMHSVLTNTYDGKTFYTEFFVLPHSGCVFDFTLLSNRPISGKESQEFETFYKSFNYGTH